MSNTRKYQKLYYASLLETVVRETGYRFKDDNVYQPLINKYGDFVYAYEFYQSRLQLFRDVYESQIERGEKRERR